jgi:subtilisin family serine protease
VAVLDTGVDASVPDLAGSVTVGPNEVPGVDPPGYQPPYEHGTYIASLIAGHGSGPGRQSGIIGIAPAARILSVRVILDDSEPGFGKFANQPADDAVSNGIRYAVQHGADVINMSLGSISPTENRRSPTRPLTGWSWPRRPATTVPPPPGTRRSAIQPRSPASSPWPRSA